MKPFRPGHQNLWVYFTFLTLFFYALISFIALIVTLLLIRIDILPTRVDISVRVLVSIFIATNLISVLISSIVSRSILQPIRQLKQAMNQVAENDFSVQLDEYQQRPGDIHELYRAFNIMVQELRRNEMLQNDFISTISHEFKTPLTVIRGNAQLLKDTDLAEDERQTALHNIIEASDRLSKLSGNILLLNKLEHQSVAIKRDAFRLDEQIRNTLVLLQQQWDEKDLELSLDLPKTIFQGNEDLLDQLWMNLLENAIKYNRPGGMIEVRLTSSEASVHVLIRDTGYGFDTQNIQRIFDKFYQEDTSRADSGNGLGLSIAKQIIDLHGGHIEASSSKNVGSTFLITLPIPEHH
ncbi:two-component sensor histidine kinase [Suicoccus acidiformans]|uniref:Heme sensor protein HssS n=1 Tax=Suicoccus acidiformans TaxID=2036206 RepID=A0A347WN81_9LACT|nr:HAMP domain-containing sensor histidine kinase [Suicoccus acidiformans]AXY26538.1 two-component sensor histidine kinase [Suicoccus acidiformans]